MDSEINTKTSKYWLPSWFADLKIKHMLVGCFAILIAFNLACYLLIGPRMLTYNMEADITDRLDDILNITDNTLTDMKNDVQVYADLAASNQDLRERMTWYSRNEIQEKVMGLTTTLSILGRRTESNLPVVFEVIPPKGFFEDGSTIRALALLANLHYLNKDFVISMQDMVSKNIVGSVSKIIDNKDTLAIVAVSPIYRLSRTGDKGGGLNSARVNGLTAVTCPLDNNLISIIKEKVSGEIHLTLYKFGKKDKNAISTATTITDENGEPLKNKKLPADILESVLKSIHSNEVYFRNITIEKKTYRLGYKLLNGDNGVIGLLEIAIPTERITKAIAQQKKQIYLITMSGFIIAMIMIFWILNSINRPLTQLLRCTELVSNGDLDQRIEFTSHNELGFLADKFNWMIASVKKKQEEVVLECGEKQEMFLSTIHALSATIDARDPYTSGHSDRVRDIAVEIAGNMSLSEDKIREISFAGILHDIGKIGVKEDILKKPDKLTEEEFEKMRMHPEIGANIIINISSLSAVVPYVLHHQERFDGNGYPEGLRGDNIPLGARILAVADAFDAMTSDRPYRKALPEEEAIEEIKRCSGTQFDPIIVEYFLKLYEEGKLQR